MTGLRQKYFKALGPCVFTLAFVFFLARVALMLKAKASPPELRFDKQSVDLGVVASGENPMAKFKLQNCGGASLLITNVSSSCASCLRVTRYPETSLAAGDRGEIDIVLRTKDLHGPIKRTVAVLSNDVKHPRIDLEVKADVSTEGPK